MQHLNNSQIHYLVEEFFPVGEENSLLEKQLAYDLLHNGFINTRKKNIWAKTRLKKYITNEGNSYFFNWIDFLKSTELSEFKRKFISQLQSEIENIEATIEEIDNI